LAIIVGHGKSQCSNIAVAGGRNVAEDYLAFGLHIRSHLPLPELLPFRGELNRPTIRIQVGHVLAPRSSNDKPVSTSGSGPNDFILDVRGVGRFQICNGEEIVAEPAEDAEMASLRSYLLGTAMAVLCYQRGLQPLHANMVSIDGSGVAFAGRSGAGKSTLAAFLSERGHHVLCDDLCVLSFEPDGRALVWPGVISFKLWNDALAALGHDKRTLERVFRDQSKFHWPNPVVVDSAPLPFSRLYILDIVTTPRAPAIRRLQGADALHAFAKNVYRPRLLRQLNQQSAPFTNAVKVLGQVQVYAFERVWGFGEFEKNVAVLEQHWRDHPP
jgi:hypothetical protein